MLSVYVIEEAAGGSGSIWVQVLVLGWFLLMTFVGWQVSRRNAHAGSGPELADPSHTDNNPSEFDTH